MVEHTSILRSLPSSRATDLSSVHEFVIAMSVGPAMTPRRSEHAQVDRGTSCSGTTFAERPAVKSIKKTIVGVVGISLIMLAQTAQAGTVTLAWDPPTSGTPPQGYAVAWGSQSGVYASYVDVGLATSHTFNNLVDGQTYFFAAFAYISGTPSAASNEVRVGGCTSAPGAPTNLIGQVSSSTVSLQWQPPGGDAPRGYQVQVGSSPGASNLANIPVVTTSLQGTASAGTYFIRVVSVNDCGSSPVSGEVSVTVGGGNGGGKKAPGAPRNPKKQVFSGGLVTLSWDPPSTGDAPETYFIEVQDHRGNGLGNVDIGGPATTVSGRVPPGTYHVRIRGANSGGVGPATAMVTVIVNP